MTAPTAPTDPTARIAGRCLVGGTAVGRVLWTDVPLSFMGGVDPRAGRVVDVHHPLRGTDLRGRVLAIPSGRGSCAGSGVILEMLVAGTAPAALVFEHDEPILTLGVVIARELFGLSIPVLQVDAAVFRALRRLDAEMRVVEESLPAPALPVAMSERDVRMLAGDDGPAARVAMRVVVRAAELEGATELLDVELAHIDGDFYQGAGSLRFATTLRDLGGRVRVPSTMNAICVDRRRWRDQRVQAALGEPSDELADAYVAMGVEPTYTCAPYCLERRPRPGQQIAWAESNAVVYANAVIGARTFKYPDHLDLLVAITGRAPSAGAHRDEGRRATVLVEVEAPTAPDDAYFATLGYLVGGLAPNDVPVVTGLERLDVSADDLKAFGAAFATTSAAAMFHIVGATPEAPAVAAALGGHDPRERRVVSAADLLATWLELSTATDEQVDLVALGNPHCSLTEVERLAGLVDGRTRSADVALVVTCGREVHERATALGYVASIERFGGTFVNDTCWCLIAEPVLPVQTRSIATTSGKYAHYGPGAGAAGRTFHLRGLADCVEAATSGRMLGRPAWLSAGLGDEKEAHD